MLENRKRKQKIKDFRRDGVKVGIYDAANHTITLESHKGYKATLTIRLTDVDGKRQLIFSGDLITSDGEALSNAMKYMWNNELPEEFSNDKELRKQLFGDKQSTETTEPEPIYFRDMHNRIVGAPNEVTITVIASYRIDNK